jgi:hypothetical protein
MGVFDVSVQVIFAPEASLADITIVCFRLQMDKLVALQVFIVDERSRACATLERSDSQMRPPVHRQSPLQLKPFATLIAHVSFLI